MSISISAHHWLESFITTTGIDDLAFLDILYDLSLVGPIILSFGRVVFRCWLVRPLQCAMSK